MSGIEDALPESRRTERVGQGTGLVADRSSEPLRNSRIDGRMVVVTGPREGVVIPALGAVAPEPERLNEGPCLRVSIRLRMSEMLGRALAPELLAADGRVVLDGRRRVDPDRADELLLGRLNEGLGRSPAVDGALELLGPVRDVPRIRRSRSKSGRPADGPADDPVPLDPRSMMVGLALRDGNDGRSIDGEDREVDGEDGRPMIDGDERDVVGDDEREGRVICGRLGSVDDRPELPNPGLEIDGLLGDREMLGRELDTDGGLIRIVELREGLEGREYVGIDGRLRLMLETLGRLRLMLETLGRLRLMLETLGRLRLMLETLGRLRLMLETLGRLRLMLGALGRLRLMLGALGRLRLMLGRLRLMLGALGRLRLMLGRLDAPLLLTLGRLAAAALASVTPATSGADTRRVSTNKLRQGRWIAAMIRISQ